MKKKNRANRLYSAVSLLLCILIILSAFALASCDSADKSSDDAIEETEECQKVIRIKKGILSGKQISGENLELVDVPKSSIPEGAIDSIEAIVGKYATIDMVIGEYVFDRMLSSDPPAEDNSWVTYIVVSDCIENVHSKDITAELQALIDSHPNRTIYFNDGNYTISSTIYLPTDKDKAVSLRLSNHAVIKAAEGWSADTAMIAIGAKSDSANTDIATNAIMGGKIDGAGVARVGVTVENCKNIFISNVTLENLKTSLWLKSSADTVNVEAVTVKGNGDDDSVAILNESSRGVFSTINIASVSTAVKNSGGDNDFRNISAKCNKALSTSVGFSELGDNNVYELCTVEDFAIGYSIKDGAKSVFEACNAYWTSAMISTQSAFVAEGTFNSVITASMARFFDATTENAFIKLTAVGSGVVNAPIFDEDACTDKSYQSVLAGSVISIK